MMSSITSELSALTLRGRDICIYIHLISTNLSSDQTLHAKQAPTFHNSYIITVCIAEYKHYIQSEK